MQGISTHLIKLAELVNRQVEGNKGVPGLVAHCHIDCGSAADGDPLDRVEGYEVRNVRMFVRDKTLVICPIEEPAHA